MFECRDLSVLRAFSRSRTTRIPAQGTKTTRFNRVGYRGEEALSWYLESTHHVSGYGELWVGISKLIAVLWLFWTIKIPPQVTKSKFIKTRLPLQLLVCPLRPWFKKCGGSYGTKVFVSLDESKVKNRFWKFWLAEFHFKEYKKWLPNQIVRNIWKLLDWGLDGRIQACRYGEVWFWTSREINDNITFIFWDYRDFHPKNKPNELCKK